MRRKLLGVRTRISIVLLLYPWIVGFNGSPRDSLSNTFTVFGGTGQYDYITRDCQNQITSVTKIPFREAGASLEEPLEDGIGYKLRGGYMSVANGVGLFQNTGSYDTGSFGEYVNTYPTTAYYGGATLLLHSYFFGLDIGGIYTTQPLQLAEFPGKNYNISGGLRIGYLDAYYFTLDLLNDDPLISSRALFSSGLGIALPSLDDGKYARRLSTLWFGLGGGPYDGMMALAKVTFPFNRLWTIHLSGGVSLTQNFEGAASGGLGYSW